MSNEPNEAARIQPQPEAASPVPVPSAAEIPATGQLVSMVTEGVSGGTLGETAPLPVDLGVETCEKYESNDSNKEEKSE